MASLGHIDLMILSMSGIMDWIFTANHYWNVLAVEVRFWSRVISDHICIMSKTYDTGQRQHNSVNCHHHNDVIMSALASQVSSLIIVCSTVNSRRRSKKTSKLRVTGLCAGNSTVTGEFPTQSVSIAENVSIWWRHHDILGIERGR